MKRIFNKKNTAAPPDSGAVLAELDNEQNEMAPGLRSLYSPQLTTSRSRFRDVVDILAKQELLTGEQVEAIRDERRKSGQKVETLLEGYHLSHEQILAAKAELYGYAFRRIEPDEVDKKAFGALDLKYIRANRLLPIAVEDNTLTVGTSNPANVFAIDDLKRQPPPPMLNLDIDHVSIGDASHDRDAVEPSMVTARFAGSKALGSSNAAS